MASAKATGPTVGLDIGTAYIKAVEMRPGRGAPQLSAIAIAPTPSNAFAGDVINDPVAMGAAIKQLLAENGISSKAVVASLSGQANFVMRILPVLKQTDKELLESMRWEIERHVPFRPEETIKDYTTLPILDPNATEMNVLLVVGNKQMVDSYASTLLNAGLTPVALDVEPLSLLRVLPIHEVRDHCIALVNIGASKMDIGVFDNGVLVFPRTIPVAGNNFTRNIADTLGLPIEQAERMKVEYGSIPESRETAGSVFDEPGFGAFDLPDFSTAGAPAATAAPADDDLGGFFSPAPSEPAAVADDDLFGGDLFAAPAPSGGSATDDDLFAPPAASVTPLAESGGFGAAASDVPGGITFHDEEADTAPAPGGINFHLDDDLPAPGFGFEADAPATPPGSPGFGFEEDASAPHPFSATPEPFGAPADLFGDAAPLVNAPIPGATPAPISPEDQTRRQITDAMLPVYADLLHEIRVSLNYYANRPNGKPVQKVYLCGGTARTHGLALALEQDLGVPALLLDPSRNFSVGGKNTPAAYYAEVAPVAALAIGLAIRDLVADPSPAATRVTSKSSSKPAKTAAKA